MIVPGMFVCSSFLISVCMFIVSKALLISSATVIVRAGGAIWLNPFATVLFSVCSVSVSQHAHQEDKQHQTIPLKHCCENFSTIDCYCSTTVIAFVSDSP